MSTLMEFTTKMPSFTHLSSYNKLKTLAKTPYDLTKEGNLSPERIAKYTSEACGFKLLYATERVDDQVLDALSSLAEDANAFDKMQKMQSGEIVNVIEGYPSENRPALHTAMRDIFDTPNTGKAALEAAQLVKREHQKLKEWIEKIDRSNQFTDLIMIGIGGSDLGPRALYLALQEYKETNRKVHFISNVDPDDAAMVLQNLDLSKTLVVVVSKSGTTLETLTNEELVKAKYKEYGLRPEEHFIAVTGKDSPMDNKNHYQECFHIWDYVGGRYSATSMVGGVMLTFGLGYEIFLEILKGAHAMDRVALQWDVKKNLPLFSALLGIWNRNFLGCATVAVIPYSQALVRFPAHLQQCDMESNGKQIDKKGARVDFDTGPIIWGEPGTNGQHSFFQLLHQGTTVVPIEFIGFKESQWHEDLAVQGTTSQQKLLSNLFAQSLALAIGQTNSNPNKSFPGNRPNRILLSKQLTPYALGALLSYYENKIAFQGFIWNINSFDQEGVQLGKVLASKFIDLFAETGKPFPQGEAMLKQLNTL